jgi:hypothetical protein
MTNLRGIVERYQTLAKNFGEPVALAAFGLSPEETTTVFTALDEDYHISRFVTFCALQGREYPISGDPVTHVKMEEGIRSLL